MSLLRHAPVFSPLLAGFVLCLLVSTGHAQAPAGPKPGDVMMEKYLAQETVKVSQRFLDGATTKGEWEARRPGLKREYLDMLGLWPLPDKTPLHATVTGTLERDDFVVEKLHYQSKPGLYVTGNLYRPKKVQGKLPAVLYVCGHSGRGRNGNKTAFQDHGMWFATNGYVCLVVDTLQLGEVPGIHHGVYSHSRWWWHSLGYTSAGVECWNGVRGIDYLVSRPDVDAERIAVTGISGGGAATFWIAAADERVKCAVPVSGMSDLECYVIHKVVNGHCDCMFLHNAYGWEWTTIAALVAPRPMLFANSDKDAIFTMDGNRRIIDRLRTLYKLYGKPELVDEHVSRGGHDYRPDLRVAIFKWINKHVKGDTGSVKDTDFKLFPNEDLRVFPEDKDVPKDALNGKIDETFVARAQVKLPEASSFPNWQKGLMQKLRAHCFHAFPERIPPAAFRRYLNPKQGDCLLATETAIEIPLLYPLGRQEGPGTLIVLGPEDDAKTIPDWAKSVIVDGPIVLLAPRGVGPTALTPMKTAHYVERSHVLLGRTVDQGRVWDIAATARYLDNETEGKGSWKAIGRGQAGILAAYAALFEPVIGEVIIVEPPASHREGPIFLNILRELDIPDALGLLAPRPLTLVNAKDKAFDRTAEIYKRAGAETKFQRR